MLRINDRNIRTTGEGFLVAAEEWDDEVAQALALAHSLELSPRHWQILRLLRRDFEQGNEPPSMRRLSKLIKEQLGAEQARSIYLMQLFGASPAKMAARLAGLPKPKNCL